MTAPAFLHAQGRKDLIRFQGNLAGGYRFSDKILTSYVQGDAEYFLHDLASVGGRSGAVLRRPVIRFATIILYWPVLPFIP